MKKNVFYYTGAANCFVFCVLYILGLVPMAQADHAMLIGIASLVYGLYHEPNKTS